MNKHVIANVVLPYAKELDANGRRMTVLKGSPLDDIMGQNLYLQYTDNMPYLDVDVILDKFDKEAFDAVVQDLVAAMNSEVPFIHNTVLGVIKDMVADLKPTLSDLAMVQPEKDMEIVKADIPAILVDSELGDYFDVYNISDTTTISVRILTENAGLYLDAKSANEVRNTIDSSGMSEVLRKWATSQSDEDLEDIWNRWFINIGGDNPNLRTFNSNLSVDYYIVGYILANALKSNVSPDAKVPLSVYNRQIALLINYFEDACKSQVARYKRDVKNNIVIKFIDAANKKIIVNREPYSEWLSEGGNIEALYGMIANPRNVYVIKNKKTLSERQDYYIKSWNAYVHMAKTAHIRTMKATLVLAYKQELRKTISQFTDDDWDILSNAGLTSESIISKVDTILQTKSVEELLDIEMTCQNIVAEGIYGFTNAQLFFDSMNQAYKENPDLTPNECASLAIISLVTRYVCGMLKIA